MKEKATPGRRAGNRQRLKVVTPLLALTLSSVVVGCGRGGSDGSRPPAIGPPDVRPAAVRRLAEWFDTKDPSRPAGTQQELTASSYLLGQLEKSGYLVNLDPVPVGNLLHSTNVLALPPSGRVSTVVVVAYDTSRSSPSQGAALGTFLELARALRVVKPRHSVEFAALGAEHVAVNGGQVGSRSLIEILKPQSPWPQIIRIAGIRADESHISVSGPQATVIGKAAGGVGTRVQTSSVLQDDVFTAAGFSETTVEGDLSLGRILLTYLKQEGQASPAP